MIYPQMMLDVHAELMVDIFAGGGGASCGIEMATGRTVDVAINHDAAAVAMHQINHPQTRHYVSDVFEVDPREVTQGRPVGLLWASPDCTYHSKARGGKPIRDANRKRRALAWVVTRWAGTVRPRVIALENVEEFAEWGPLVGPKDQLTPCPRRRGRTFRKWVRSLERLGYQVEWRELRACDYGAPTIRKRLFLIARCDGEPIVWPEPTHGPGRPLPYRTAAECIDWTIPMLSIFATREEAKVWAKLHGVGVPVRPLAEATLRRVARGVWRWVVETGEPFIVGVGGRQGQSPERSLREPYQTITAKGDAAIVVPTLVQTGYGERTGQAPRSLDIHAPLGTIVGGASKHALVAAFLAQHNSGFYQGAGRSLSEPLATACASGSPQAIVAAHLSTYYGGESGDTRGMDLREPLRTQGTENRFGVVAAFMQTYYGQGVGQHIGEPMRTIPTKDRMGLVTVNAHGYPAVIADIAMRMLQPHELYRAQGFPDSYVINRGVGGRIFTKTEQVRMVGNSVCPPMAAALVRANCPELIARDEVVQAPKRRGRRTMVAA